MDIINSLINFFGLNPDITTFTDFTVWFTKMILAFLIVAITIKALFKATWKIERGLR